MAERLHGKWAWRACVRVALKTFAVAPVCALLLLFGGLQRAFALEDANWEAVLKRYQESYHLALVYLTGYHSKLKSETKAFRKGLVKLEKKRGQLFLWFGGTYDPEDLKYTLMGTARLRKEAADLIKPFNDMERALDLFKSKVEEVEMEILGQLTYAPKVQYSAALKEYLQHVSELKTRMVRVSGPVEEANSLCNDFLKRLNEMEKAAQTKIPQYERIYYLNAGPCIFTHRAWSTVGEDVSAFLSFFDILKEGLTDGQEVKNLVITLLQSCLIGGVLILLGWLAIWKTAPRFAGCPDLSRLFTPVVLLSLSAGLCWAAREVHFMLNPYVSGMEEILFAAGLVSLCCSLRGMTRGPAPFLRGRHPLWVLWMLATTGLVLRVLEAPYPFEAVLWIAVLVLAVLRIERESGKSESPPKLVFMHSASGICLILAILAISGFMNLSILITFILFYFVVTFRLGQYAVSLLRTLDDRIAAGGVPAAAAGFIQSIGFPAVILGFLILNLWLLASRVGGDDVFHKILTFEFAWRDFQINLKKLFLTIVGFYLTRAAILISDSLVGEFRSRRPDVDLAVMDSFLRWTKYAWWFFFSLCALYLVGFSLTSIAVIAGGLSVGIGFGLQHIMNNFFSGLILLFGRAVQPGDTIQIGNTLGEVRRVTIRSTVVQTRENATLFIPNSDLMSNQIVNWSHRDREVQREVTVGVAYGSDTGKVRDLLFQAAAVHPNVLSDPPPQVLFHGFGASSLDFKVKFRIDNIDDDLEVTSDVCFEIDRLFRENDIEIAFPQSDLHLKTASGLENLWGRGSKA